MLLDHKSEYDSEWSAMNAIAVKLGCTAETLRQWVRQTEKDLGLRDGVTSDERERLKKLERENRELKRANEILRKASAYFAQARAMGRPPCADRSDGVVYRRVPGWVRGRADL
jgi:transposase